MKKKAQATQNQTRAKQPVKVRRAKAATPPKVAEIPLSDLDILTDQAKDIYKELHEHLVTSNDHRPIDSKLLMMAAFQIDVCFNAMKRMRNRRYIETYANGVRGISKEMDLINKTMAQAVKLMEELGVGPAARQKINAFLDKDEGRPDPILKAIAGGLKNAKG